MKLTKTEYYVTAIVMLGLLVEQLLTRHFLEALSMALGFSIGRIWRHYES